MVASAVAIQAIRGLNEDIEGRNALNGDTQEVMEEFLADPLLTDVLATTWFRRLYEIPFMGALAYVDDASASCQTRGHHSLLVALFALYCARRAGVEDKARREWVLSAMLHDVHHLPFSHTLERALRVHEGFSTREFNQRIMRADTGGPNDESLVTIAASHGVRLLEDTFLTRGRSQWPPFYRSTHNVDTLEGIVRTALANGLASPSGAVLRRRRILDVIATPYESQARDLEAAIQDFDWFWNLKNDVYMTAIYEPRRVLFEAVIAEYLYRKIAEYVEPEVIHLVSDADVFLLAPEIRRTMADVWGLVLSGARHVGPMTFVREEEMPSTVGAIPQPYCLPVRRFSVRKAYTISNLGDSRQLRTRYQVRPGSVLVTVSQTYAAGIEDAVGFSISDVAHPLEGSFQDVLF